MQVGVVFPQTEFGADPEAIREYVRAAEDLGYAHVLIADHVVGADPQFHQLEQASRSQYTHTSVVHEPLTLLGYIAGITDRLQLATGVLVLPQRQTVLVAKQAAELDVLSGGKLRVGIGVGWNPVEYEALGQDFHNRGRRSEEQIAVLRALWTQEVVSFEGRWHQISHAGLNPLPVQRPIPIWMGVGRRVQRIPPDSVLRRIARIGDGWFTLFALDEAGRETISRMRQYAGEAGRDPAAIGMECRIVIEGKSPEVWLKELNAWREIGATHAAVETRWGGLSSPDAHVEAIRRFKEVLDSADGSFQQDG